MGEAPLAFAIDVDAEGKQGAYDSGRDRDSAPPPRAHQHAARAPNG